MENLHEFDELPISNSFCKQITIQEFEAQAESYTDSALKELYRSMDEYPLRFQNVIRRIKKSELENSSVKFYLESKLNEVLHGETNVTNPIGMPELRQRLTTLKREMETVYNYEHAKRVCHSESKSEHTSQASPDPASDSIVPPPPPVPTLEANSQMSDNLVHHLLDGRGLFKNLGSLDPISMSQPSTSKTSRIDITRSPTLHHANDESDEDDEDEDDEDNEDEDEDEEDDKDDEEEDDEDDDEDDEDEEDEDDDEEDEEDEDEDDDKDEEDEVEEDEDEDDDKDEEDEDDEDEEDNKDNKDNKDKANADKADAD